MAEPGKLWNATWLTPVHFRKVPHPAWKPIQVRRWNVEASKYCSVELLFLVDEAKTVSSPAGACDPVDEFAAAHVRIFQAEVGRQPLSSRSLTPAYEATEQEYFYVTWVLR